MKDGRQSKVTTTHMEESMSRIKSDAVDREKLRLTLCSFIDPLDPSSHPEGVVNIANGLVSTNNVNVDKALELGQQQMDEFETGWPSSFHKTLKKNVIAMRDAKKSIKIEGTPVYDTELLYSRIIGLQQSRDIRDILAYELSAVPSALLTKPF